METETTEESSEFTHCVLASTQQNLAKNSTKGNVRNIVVTLTSPEDLAAAYTRSITKIAKDKCTTLQDGHRDDGLLDLDKRNEELPD